LLKWNYQLGTVNAISHIMGIGENCGGVFGWVEVGGVSGGIVDEE